MNKILYTLTFLFALGLGLNQVSAQCVDFTAGPFNNFGAAPCDDGTGCATTVLPFEAFASESYIVTNFVAGGEYEFNICDGPNAGTWNPDFTIQAPSGAIDAFGAGDGDNCTITWTASEDGTYIIIINEQEQCGGGPNVAVDNGFPTLSCLGNAPCGETPDCDTGTLLTNGLACAANGTFDLQIVGEVIPPNNSFIWLFDDSMGGTGGIMGGFTFPGPLSVTYDNDLNGLLSANNFAALGGTWVVSGLVVDNASGAPCSTTELNLIVDFDMEGPSISSLTETNPGELTVVATGGVEPYTYLWDDPAAQTTATATNLGSNGIFSVIVTDANGCQAFESFEFGAFMCSAGNLTNSGEVSICDIDGTFDFGLENLMLPDENGAFGFVATNELGGTGGGAPGADGQIAIQLIENVSWDATFNGVLGEALSGPWTFRGVVFEDNAACAFTPETLVVSFGTESPGIIDITSNDVDEITVTATFGVEPYSYLWSDGQTTQTAVGLVPGIYTVIVSDANGCQSTEEEFELISTSTNSIAALESHNITPNPNNGSFSVNLNFENSQFVEVEVLDFTGKVIEKLEREMTAGNFDFNLNNTPNGLYFVRITAGDESLTERIAVNN